MTVITLYNINRSPSFFVSDVNIYKNDGNQTKLYRSDFCHFYKYYIIYKNWWRPNYTIHKK